VAVAVAVVVIVAAEVVVVVIVVATVVVVIATKRRISFRIFRIHVNHFQAGFWKRSLVFLILRVNYPL
jgi:hypothetical protein